ncbi:MAG TPA: hypothetical protein VGD17_12215 [Chitinophagaceae bacterium]
MENSKTVKRDLYYTLDHEWIDFQGSVAYVGICQQKLSRINGIQQVKLEESAGFLKKGEVLCTLQHEEKTVKVHMPVDGKIMRINEELLENMDKEMLQHTKSNGWIALIVPSLPYMRTGLLPTSQYRELIKKSRY